MPSAKSPPEGPEGPRAELKPPERTAPPPPLLLLPQLPPLYTERPTCVAEDRDDDATPLLGERPLADHEAPLLAMADRTLRTQPGSVGGGKS